MRLVLLGSGEFGLPTFKDLAHDHDIAMVISQPDRPAGRKRKLTPTPIAAWASDAGLPLQTTDNVNTEAFIAQTQSLGADAAVVIAFGQKLSPAFIAALGKLVVNLHSSLLPKHRGASPINTAMIEGETRTGLSVIALAQKMDAGDVYGTAATDIDPLETAGELHDRLAAMGPALVSRVLAEHEAGTLAGTPQNHDEATLAPKLSKADGTVAFDQPAAAARARIHGLSPWPGCRVTWQHPDGSTEPLSLLRVRSMGSNSGNSNRHEPGTILDGNRVACREGLLELIEVQSPGKRAMSIDDFTRGKPLEAGGKLRPLDA